MCLGCGSPPHATRALGRGSCGVPADAIVFLVRAAKSRVAAEGTCLTVAEDPVGPCLRVAALRFILRSSGLFQP